MREKKYTKTVAFRVTEYEWQLIQFAMGRLDCKKPSEWVRTELQNALKEAANNRQEAAKKAEAAAKRAYKKANADVNA